MTNEEYAKDIADYLARTGIQSVKRVGNVVSFPVAFERINLTVTVGKREGPDDQEGT